MTQTRMAGLSAAALVLAALPLATASPADDVISRTFPYMSGPPSSFPVSWHDPAANFCLLSPVSNAAGSPVHYFDSLRIHYNVPGFGSPQTVGGSVAIPTPCPAVINPACNVGCTIHIDPLTVGSSTQAVAVQSPLVCTQQSAFIMCVVTQHAWWVDRCPWNAATFQGRAAGSGKGLLAAAGQESEAFSRDIGCSAYAGLGYDYSPLVVPSWLASGSIPLPVAQVVPFNDGADQTGYVVSCYQPTYTTVDHSGPIPVISAGNVEDGVDWFLVLDLDATDLGTVTANWVGAVTAHLGPGGSGQEMAGLPDLGGDNDCDFPLRSAPPQCFDEADNDGDGATDFDDDSPGPISPAPPNTGTGGCWHLYCKTVGATTCTPYYDATDTTEGH